MQRYLLYANGPDQVGIVASVTKSLAESNCNLEDSRMTILHGQFSIMMVISIDHLPSDDLIPPGSDVKSDIEATKELIESSLSQTASRLGLYISLVTLYDSPSTPMSGFQSNVFDTSDYLCVSVHGADRIGIVSSVTEQIAKSGASVIDLATRLIDSSYVLVMTVALAEGSSTKDLEDSLNKVASDLGVACNISSATPDVL